MTWRTINKNAGLVRNSDVDIKASTDLLLGQDDESEQLVFEALHRDGEVDDRRLRAHFRRIRRVAELRRYVQPEAGHHVDLLLADLHLERATGLDEILLEEVVERWVELLCDVLDEKRIAERQRVFQVRPKVLVVERSYLQESQTQIMDDKLTKLCQQRQKL